MVLLSLCHFTASYLTKVVADGNALNRLFFEIDRNMSSDENLRKLGNCITALQEQADMLRKHAEALLQDRSRFDPDQLSKVASDIVRAVNECKNSYRNYLATLSK